MGQKNRKRRRKHPWWNKQSRAQRLRYKKLRLERGIIDEEEPALISEATPGFLSEVTPGFVSEAAPGFISAAAVPGFISAAAPGFISAAEPGFISAAEPGFISEEAPTLISEMAPALKLQAAPALKLEAAPSLKTDVAPVNDCSSSSQDYEELEVLVNPFEFYNPTDFEERRDFDVQDSGIKECVQRGVCKEPLKTTVKEIRIFKQNQIFILPNSPSISQIIICPLQSRRTFERKS